MPKVIRTAGLVILFAAGALLAAAIAGEGVAQTTTETETETTVETTTAPGTTAVTTETLQQTTTRRVIVTTSPTTTSASADDDVPIWAWILIGALALGVIGLLALLLSRRGGGGVPLEERRRRLDAAVSSWIAQGWAIESQSGDSAVLRRGNEWMLVGVDPTGSVTTRPVAPQ